MRRTQVSLAVEFMLSGRSLPPWPFIFNPWRFPSPFPMENQQ